MFCQVKKDLQYPKYYMANFEELYKEGSIVLTVLSFCASVGVIYDFVALVFLNSLLG